MNHYKALIASTCLLLAGCNQQFAIITFEQDSNLRNSVNELEVQRVYVELMGSVLSRLGVHPDDVEIMPDQFHPWRLRLNIRNRSMPTEQRQAIKTYLLSLQEEKSKAFSLAWRLDATTALKQGVNPYSSRSSGRVTASGMYTRTEPESDYAWRDNEKKNGNCYIHMNLRNAFPEHVTAVKALAKPVTLHDEEANAHITLGAEGRFGVFKVPGILTFSEPQIMDLVAQQKINIIFERSPIADPYNYLSSSYRNQAIQKVIFELPEQTETELTGEFYVHLFDNEQIAACEQRATSYGRPFSFNMGIGMDRMETVTFLD